MAIKINNTTVIDNSRNVSAGVGTFTQLDVPPAPLTFSPADGATDITPSQNIVITFDQQIRKGSGNIRFRSVSATGTILETISVSSGNVTISGGQVTIAHSTLPITTVVYVVIDDGAFLGVTDQSSNNIINTYNFTTANIPPLGANVEGGYLICLSASTQWIVAPCTTEIAGGWYAQRTAVLTCAQSVTGCSGWFLPTISQLQNPGYTCRTYWDAYRRPSNNCYVSDTPWNNNYGAWRIDFANGGLDCTTKNNSGILFRAFRCVSY